MPTTKAKHALWVMLFELMSVPVDFPEHFGYFLWCGCAGGAMACTVCLGVCLLGRVVGRSLWYLILFLYVNRFKWHMFEVPTRRSVSGYIITAHRCLCIHGCYWFSRAISHILAAWKESTNIRIHGHQHLLNRYDIFTNHLFCMYCTCHMTYSHPFVSTWQHYKWRRLHVGLFHSWVDFA